MSTNNLALNMIKIDDMGGQDPISWYDSTAFVNGGPSWEDPTNSEPQYSNQSMYPPNPADGSGTQMDDHFRIFSRFSFEDSADIAPEFGESEEPNMMDLMTSIMELFPIFNNNTVFVSQSIVQNSMSSVAKAMLLALLDNNGKRTSTLANRTLAEKKEIFFNTLKKTQYRNNNSLPWSSWRDTHSTVNISSVSRVRGEGDEISTAIFVTSSPHGLDSSYDDWCAIININDSSFNTPIVDYPNGVPITVINSNTFSMKFGTAIDSIKSVSGTAEIRTGWGNETIKFHMYI